MFGAVLQNTSGSLGRAQNATQGPLSGPAAAVVKKYGSAGALPSIHFRRVGLRREEKCA